MGEYINVLLLKVYEVDNKYRSGRGKQYSEATNLVAKYLHQNLDLVGMVWKDYLRGE